MKRVLSFILTVLIMFTLPCTTNAAKYKDISVFMDDIRWFDAVNYVSDNGYMKGMGDSFFGADKEVTRAVLVTVLYRYSGDMGEYENPFKDVVKGSFYYDAAGWAYTKGITKGTGNGNFSPNNIVTREELLCILMNYSVYTGRYTPCDINAVMKYEDACHLHDYAVNAVSWALENHILQPSSSRMGVRDKISRLNLAVYLHRYSIYIDKLDHTKDIFGFANSYDCFSSNYYLNNEDIEFIKRAVTSYYGENKARSVLLDVYAKTGAGWYGSCQGMAVAVALNKLGIIDLEGRFGTDSVAMIPRPCDDTDVMSLINLYQITQSFGFLERNSFRKAYPIKYKEGLRAFTEEIDEKGIALFSFYWIEGSKEVGHTLVAYDIEELDDECYRITTYDCNSPFETVDINIDVNDRLCSVEGYPYPVTGISYTTDFDAYRYLDIDGIYNADGGEYFPLRPFSAYSLQDESEAVIRTYAYKDYRIDSEDVGEIRVRDREVTAEMDIMGQSIELTGGKKEPCIDVYNVPISNCYILEPTDGEYLFEIFHGEYDVSVKGRGAERISVGNSGNVFMNSSSRGDFVMTFSVKGEYDYITVKAETEGNAHIFYDDEKIELGGITSDVELTCIKGEKETVKLIPFTSEDTVILYH